jgi:hypothetical protein
MHQSEKIAVSASGTNLDCSIDPRFGGCAYFIIVKADDMSFEPFDNESVSLGGGAGLGAARSLYTRPPESSSLSKKEELRWLKEQAGVLHKQIQANESRIKNMDKAQAEKELKTG